MLIYAVYFAVFVTAILLFEFFANVLAERRERNRSINRRMAILQQEEESSAALTSLLRERGLGDSFSFLSWEWLRELWTQSGVTMTPNRFLLLTTLAAVVMSALVTIFFSNLLLIALIFVALALLIPLVVLRRMRSVRLKNFTKQLPNALDVLVRSLRAGHPVTSSIAMVGREMADPIGTEFGIVSDEITFGQDVEGAILNLYNRVGAEDLRLLVTTISVQRSTGGNLAEVLGNLAHVIRERLHMRARIRALSAEGRFTAWFMAVFPFIMYFMIDLLSPVYFDAFWASPFVVPVLGVCAFLLIVGNYILFKMVNFDF